MKKLIFLILLNLLLFHFSFAREFNLGLLISHPNESDNSEGGLGYSIYFEKVTENEVDYRLTYGGFSSETKVDILSQGDYHLDWLELTVLLKSKKSKVQPYVGIGVGYYFFDHSLSDYANRFLYVNGYSAKEEIHDIMSVHFIGGISFEIFSGVAIETNLKYLYLYPKVDIEIRNLNTNITNTYERKVLLNTLQFNMGIVIGL